MEIVISILLGVWTALAGVLCLFRYKKDFKHILNKEENKEEDKHE